LLGERHGRKAAQPQDGHGGGQYDNNTVHGTILAVEWAAWIGFDCVESLRATARNVNLSDGSN
jgi:hypothetical protein